MNDDNGYLGQFNQCLYYARLHTDNASHSQSDALGSSPQQNCYLEAAVQCLVRAHCFLVAAQMPALRATALLKSPRALAEHLDQAISEQPTAALSELKNAFFPLQATTQSTLDWPTLLAVYARQWQAAAAQSRASRGGLNIIRVKEQAVTVDQCRAIYSGLLELSERLNTYGQEC